MHVRPHMFTSYMYSKYVFDLSLAHRSSLVVLNLTAAFCLYVDSTFMIVQATALTFESRPHENGRLEQDCVTL